jgi:hypothetical protein
MAASPALSIVFEHLTPPSLTTGLREGAARPSTDRAWLSRVLLLGFGTVWTLIGAFAFWQAP